MELRQLVNALHAQWQGLYLASLNLKIALGGYVRAEERPAIENALEAMIVAEDTLWGVYCDAKVAEEKLTQANALMLEALGLS